MEEIKEIRKLIKSGDLGSCDRAWVWSAITTLLSVVDRYGGHRDGCSNHLFDEHHPCDCGWDSIKAEGGGAG